MPYRHDALGQQTETVARAIGSMRTRLERSQPLGALARSCGFSARHFHRMFRDITGVTPARFRAALRMAEARRLLVHSSLTVGEVSWRVGYESLGTFTTQFSRLAGVSPAGFRRLMRSLQRDAVAAHLPTGGPGQPADTHRQTDGGPVLALSGAVGSGALVAGGLCPTGGLPDRPGSWTFAAGPGPVHLPGAPHPGEYAAFSVVIPAGVRVVDALVDGAPSSYLVGAVRMWLPATRGGRARVVLRHPRVTDPPVLAVTPLRWLAVPER